VIVTKRTGMQTVEKAYDFLLKGGDTLDAAIMVGKAQEDDPKDDTVGLGGLPNEDGLVELDSCCMHGPTRRAGSVGGVRNIKNVSLLAKAVMEHTGHVMLVAEGAEKFAETMGFPKENLLTEAARKIWVLWKESHSDQDWWGPSLADPDFKVPANTPPTPPPMADLYRRLEDKAAALGIPPADRAHAINRVLRPPTGTIHVSVLNAKGEMSGMTTTSGLAWKLAGRLGDSPIIGAGCYTDQEVGSAGATGSGEENIKVAGAHSIVENMRKGMSPKDAGIDVLKRIARAYEKNPTKLRYISMVYYILRKDGEYAGVTMWSGPPDQPMRFVVHDGKPRYENAVALFQGDALDFPPAPQGTMFR
jgi:N4-(beta-N-acetylglucosaminyl)-L-asparaginase